MQQVSVWQTDAQKPARGGSISCTWPVRSLTRSYHASSADDYQNNRSSPFHRIGLLQQRASRGPWGTSRFLVFYHFTDNDTTNYIIQMWASFSTCTRSAAIRHNRQNDASYFVYQDGQLLPRKLLAPLDLIDIAVLCDVNAVLFTE